MSSPQIRSTCPSPHTVPVLDLVTYGGPPARRARRLCTGGSSAGGGHRPGTEGAGTGASTILDQTSPGMNCNHQKQRCPASTLAARMRAPKCRNLKIVEQRAAPWTGCVRDIQLPEKRLSTHRVQRQQHELNAHHTPYRVHVLPPHTRIRDRRPLRAQACNRARTLSNTCVEIKWWWGLLASSISLGLSHCSTH